MKKQTLEELTRKYFWEQKIKEVLKFIFIVVFILTITLINGLMYLQYSPQGMCTYVAEGELKPLFLNQYCIEYIDNPFVIGLIVDFVLAFIGVVLWFIVYFSRGIFTMWIDSNWKEAEERAREDLGGLR